MTKYRAEVTVSITKEIEFETDDDNDVASQIEQAVNSGDIDIPEAWDDIKVSDVQPVGDELDGPDPDEDEPHDDDDNWKHVTWASGGYH